MKPFNTGYDSYVNYNKVITILDGKILSKREIADLTNLSLRTVHKIINTLEIYNAVQKIAQSRMHRHEAIYQKINADAIKQLQLLTVTQKIGVRK